jgi:G3E family GTPase
VPVAQTWSFEDADGASSLADISYIDTMVTVVDCFNFFKDFSTVERLADRRLTDMEGDDRTIVNLLTDQVEFADVIILNKTDLVDDKTLQLLHAAIARLNPAARILHAVFGKVEPEQILNTGLFDFEKAQNAAGWIAELNNEHTPETEAYGISSFVFRNKRPFHPERFWKYLNEQYPANIIRAKGLFWLASRPDDAINFSQAGGSSRIEKAGVWWCSMPYAERIRYSYFADNKDVIESRWDKKWGDRMNEIVFIGQEMDKEQIVSELNNCLLADTELFMYETRMKFKDEFPV